MTPRLLAGKYREATFNSLSTNLIDPNRIPQLNALIEKIESDPTLNVVAFKSAVDAADGTLKVACLRNLPSAHACPCRLEPVVLSVSWMVELNPTH